jgi:hypothetical protein
MSKSPWRVVLALFVALVAVACGGGGERTAAPAPAAAPAASAGAVGSVAGTILYTGSEDPDAAINMNADPNCAALHPQPIETERVVKGAGNGLANVFVYLKSGVSGSYPVPAEAVTLNQQGCTYHPHVFGIRVGQKFIVKNSDETLHNIHAVPAVNQEFNQAQPFVNMTLEKTFDKVEVMLPFKCDVHPWMSAHLGVLNHPFFAVTGPDGSFSIGNVPAGTYTAEAWHEVFGPRTAEVTVSAGGAADWSFDYAG